MRWPRLLNPKQLSQILKHQKNPLTALKIFNTAKTKYPNYTHNAAVYATMINLLAASNHHDQMTHLINHQLRHESCELKDTLLVSIIESYAHLGKIDEAIELFKTLGEFNCVNWTGSLNTLLRVLVEKGRLVDFWGLFEEYSTGFEMKSRLKGLNMIMGVLCRAKRSDLAIRVFEEMDRVQCCVPDRESYRVLMRGLCDDGRINEATHLLYSMFSRISQKGYGGDVVIYRILLDCLSDNGMVDDAVGILEKILRKGLRAPKSLRNVNILEQIRHCDDDPERAKVLINEALIRAGIPSVESYGAIARDLYSEGKVEDAEKVLNEMRGRGFQVTPAMYEAKVAALCREKKVDEARRVVVEEMVGHDCVPTPKVYSMVVKGYCDEGRSDVAVGFVDEMASRGHCFPTKETFGVVVDGLCRDGRFVEASKMLERMLNGLHWPGRDIFSDLITGLCSMRKLYEAVMWLEEMISQGNAPKASTWHALVASFVQNKEDIDACLEMLNMLSSS